MAKNHRTLKNILRGIFNRICLALARNLFKRTGAAGSVFLLLCSNCFFLLYLLFSSRTSLFRKDGEEDFSPLLFHFAPKDVESVFFLNEKSFSFREFIF